MFIGSINQHLRDILNDMSKGWQDKPVYVGCSGNFTVERVLKGHKNLSGNDVSLYSCLVGNYLAGRDTDIQVGREDLNWLSDYLKNPLDKIATLLLCSAYFDFIDRTTPYHLKMSNHYQANFQALHEKTRSKIEKALTGHSLKEYYPMDVLDYATEIVPDRGAVFISFPPTYNGGCERLYKKIDEVFEWDRPVYHLFNEESFKEFTGIMMKKEIWVTLRDHPVEEMEEYLTGLVQSGLRSKPVYVYSNQGTPRIVFTRQKLEALNVERLGENEELRGDVTFRKITQGQMNLLRSQYLSKKIVPAGAQLNTAIFTGGKLIGAAAFSRSQFDKQAIYMMTDFSIRPLRYGRISKLILSTVISRELKDYLENCFNMRVESICTTAFTDKPISMKYRGIFELYNRKEGMLNYTAKAGKWTLAEGYQWWMKKHSTK